MGTKIENACHTFLKHTLYISLFVQKNTDLIARIIIMFNNLETNCRNARFYLTILNEICNNSKA